MKTLEGQVALVTGSSRGLGRSIVFELAERGARVVVVARTAHERDGVDGSVASTAARVRSRGYEALEAPCDLTDDDALTALVQRVLNQWERIDILVNCAGIVSFTTLLETSLKRFDLLWRLNVRAPFNLMRLVAPHMVERGRGHIVNIGTMSSQWRGSKVPLGFVGYTSTKAALVRMSHAIAIDLRGDGVAVNVVAPGAFIPTTGWETLSAEVVKELPNIEPADFIARTVAWVVEQQPSSFTGRFVGTQDLLASVGELDGDPVGWKDLPMVDFSDATDEHTDRPVRLT